MSDATVMRMRAMADLEIHMGHLEKIIVQKDGVIEGLRLTLDKALRFLETGAAEKLRKEQESFLSENNNFDDEGRLRTDLEQCREENATL